VAAQSTGAEGSPLPERRLSRIAGIDGKGIRLHLAMTILVLAEIR
jgi:hypothetical protein